MADPPHAVTLQEALRDRYAIERELGLWGMATVYLARDLRHERPVALVDPTFDPVRVNPRFRRLMEGTA